MPAAIADTPVRTLASILPGEQLRIRHIIFDTVRARCEWSGLREGSVVACLAATTHHVLLRRADGRAVAVERWWAGFVEAELHDDPAPADEVRCA